MLKWDTILFDFDYTLADSTKGESESINFALTSIGFPRVSEKEIGAVMGLSLKNAFLKLVGDDNLSEFEKFQVEFIKKALTVMADLTVIYPETYKILETLKECSISVGIVSIKYNKIIRQILDREGLSQFVGVVVGGDDVPVSKPNPRGLVKAMKTLGGIKPRTVFVGDSVIDAETALRAGVSFVAVLTGHTTLLQFRSYKIDAYANGLREIPRIIGLN